MSLTRFAVKDIFHFILSSPKSEGNPLCKNHWFLLKVQPFLEPLIRWPRLLLSPFSLQQDEDLLVNVAIFYS